MEDRKGSNETVLMAPLNGRSAIEPEKAESIETASPTPSQKSTSVNSQKKATQLVAIDVPNEAPMVKKTVTHEYALNLPNSDFNSILPAAMQRPAPVEPGDESNDEKKKEREPASIDCPDGFNQYRNQKSFSQGLLDIALFISNVNQLKSVTKNSTEYGSFELVSIVSLLLLSILLQIAVGLILLLSSRFDVSKDAERRTVYRMGNYVLAGIFLITVLNLFIGVFYDYGNPIHQQLIKESA